MLGYSKVSKAEMVRRRLTILEAEAGKCIKEFEEAVEEGDVRMQDCKHSLWKRSDEKIQLLHTDPDEYERKHGL
ncbi:hypothetical protein ABPG77_010675 [Micractinium sp. CCAP 211/92]